MNLVLFEVGPCCREGATEKRETLILHADMDAREWLSGQGRLFFDSQVS